MKVADFEGGRVKGHDAVAFWERNGVQGMAMRMRRWWKWYHFYFVHIG